jgi:signal peptidase I
MENQPQKPAKSNFFKDLLKFAVIALAIVLPIRFFVAQPFIVNGASMDPTFITNQYLIVDELSYHFQPIARGDVIVFKYPNDVTKYFIKRVIGLPGETVQIEGTKVYIKNSEYPNGLQLEEDYIAPENAKDDHMLVTLKADEYFVMGDNRLGSFDSRAWGPVPKANIIGRPVLRLFPFNTVGLFPGEALVKTK